MKKWKKNGVEGLSVSKRIRGDRIIITTESNGGIVSDGYCKSYGHEKNETKVAATT